MYSVNEHRIKNCIINNSRSGIFFFVTILYFYYDDRKIINICLQTSKTQTALIFMWWQIINILNTVCLFCSSVLWTFFLQYHKTHPCSRQHWKKNKYKSGELELCSWRSIWNRFDGMLEEWRERMSDEGRKEIVCWGKLLQLSTWKAFYCT